jgi:hypothetical protein
MALESRPGQPHEYGHCCQLPWPKDPEIPEGHVCECGRRWVFQPARWEPLCTLEEFRLRQEAGEFLRGIIPRFRSEPRKPVGELVAPTAGAVRCNADARESAVIINIRSARIE